MTTPVVFCIMPIHGHCTLMYPGLLYVFAVICRFVLLYYADWVAGLPFGILHHSTSRMDFNVFRPSYDPSDLTHKGASVIAYFTTPGESHFVWPSPVLLQTL